jgi:DedD protein
MAEAQDVDTLKRRGRRRLVGAVALVLLAVIFLPMVFDPEPRRPAPPVSVRIPGEDESAFSPKLAPKAAPQKKKAEENKQAETAPEKKSEPAEAERQRAEAALANAEYFVQVGAFANADAITARLARAKVPYYTEKVATAKGPVTRVRAGPFVSKDAAEKALKTLKSLGFTPAGVATKSG